MSGEVAEEGVIRGPATAPKAMIIVVGASGSCSEKTNELLFGSGKEGIDNEVLPSLEIVQKSKETVSMFGCCTDMNEKLFGIDGKGCDAEIMISSGVVGKCSKGKTEHNKVIFEVGREGVKPQEESGCTDRNKIMFEGGGKGVNHSDMFGCCTDRNKILFEAGGEEVQQQEGGLVIHGSSSGEGPSYQ